MIRTPQLTVLALALIGAGCSGATDPKEPSSPTEDEPTEVTVDSTAPGTDTSTDPTVDTGTARTGTDTGTGTVPTDTGTTDTGTADPCVDLDGDGFGQACTLGPDCDDGDDGVHTLYSGYIDADEDGVAADGKAVTVCAGDALPTGYSDLAGDDCDDADAAVALTLTGFVDADGDGVAVDMVGETLCTDGQLPIGYLPYGGSDCDDSDVDNFVSCSTCVDQDQDGSFAGCDAYTTRVGPDCDDGDVDNFAQCATCADVDGDGWFAGCDSYTQLQGPDCNDDDVDTFPGAAAAEGAACMRDADDDGYGDSQPPVGAVAGTDCDDGDPNNHALCAACTDADGDGAYVTCDAYVTIDTDCDDGDPNVFASCGSCVDDDKDLSFVGCDAYATVAGPDCDDGDPLRHPGEPELADDGIDNDCVDGDLSAQDPPSDARFVAIDHPACDDEGPGSADEPFCTLFPAVTAVDAGPIFIAGGVIPVDGLGVDEHANLHPVRLGLYGGYDQDSWSRTHATPTVIDLDGIEGYGFRFGVDRLVVEHVELVGAPTTGGTIALFSFSEESFFDHVTTDFDNVGIGLHLQGDAWVRDSFFLARTSMTMVNNATDDLVVLRSRFEQEPAGAVGSAVYSYGDALVVANNEFVSTHGAGGLQPVVQVRGLADVAVLNNSFLIGWAFPGAGSPDAIHVEGDMTDREVVVLNNALWAEAGVPRFYSEVNTGSYAALVARGNLIESATFGANTSWAVRQGVGALDHFVLAGDFEGCTGCLDVRDNRDADPGFLDTAARDFRAGAGAAMVDAGVDVTQVYRDWYELRRPLSGPLRLEFLWDAGAHELND